MQNQPPQTARQTGAAHPSLSTPRPVNTPTVNPEGRVFQTMFGLARLALGAIFLWAFLDKAFGLGWSTKSENAWITGGSPTKGYLGSSFGPLADLFQGIAGNPITDALFMAGLAGVGIALLLGLAVRLAGWSGTAMVLFMYLSHPAFATQPHGANPLLDSHIVYALLLLAIAYGHAGRYLGLEAQWARLPFVQKNAWLV